MQNYVRHFEGNIAEFDIMEQILVLVCCNSFLSSLYLFKYSFLEVYFDLT